MKNDRYTNRAYWEIYYEKHKQTDKNQIIKVCSSYDKFWDILVDKDSSLSNSILEIGAFPGRYIAYLASKYGLYPTALDFNSNIYVMEKVFEIMDVEKFNILTEDFFNLNNDHLYDYVYSLGFVEHFENFNEVLDRHVDLLKPGGNLLIMLPNKRYLRKWFDLLLDYDNLKIHNLKTMRLSVFKNLAYRKNLQILHLGYYGGFVYNVHHKLNYIQNLLHRIIAKLFFIFNPFLEKRPNRFYSSTLVCILKKPIT